MERIELFTQLMDTLFSFSQASDVNQKLPRTYGTDDVLYIAEVHLIRDIADHDGITVTQLAQLNKKTKSAISQLVDKLVQKDLISKQKHPDSNRQVALYITERGRIVNKYHANFDRKEYSKILSQLNNYSDEDFLKVIELLNIISSGNEKAIKLKRKLQAETPN